MSFQTILICAGLVCMSFALLAIAIPLCAEHDFHPLRELLRRFRALPCGAQAFLAAFALVLIVHGSTKTNAPPSGLPPQSTAPRLLMARPPSTGFTSAQIAAGAAVTSVGTDGAHDFSPPDGAHVVERWRLRGAANERIPLGCDIWEDGAMTVDTSGRILTPSRVFSPLGLPVGIVPAANWARLGAASLCWWMTTASNSTVVCWQNALLYRDTNTPVSVLAEFFRDGRFEYRYDLSSAGGAASNVFARIETTNGVEGVALGAGVTTVRGHLLLPEDGVVADRDGDGIPTHDEIFVYGTDPDLPDTDGDGMTDGEEILDNGGDPLVGDVSDADILARIGAGGTNEVAAADAPGVGSAKLWDGFALRDSPGTNALWSRTFEIDRKNGWTSCYVSARSGDDAPHGWTLDGVALEWSDDAGASGTVTASPRNDSLFLPLSTNATSVTLTLRPASATGGCASPQPLYLLVYTPNLEFPGAQEVEGDDGCTYFVFTDPGDAAFSPDDSRRPCRAQASDGEATAADYAMPTEPGVYGLPTKDRAYLVILDPWVSYGSPHYGCRHEYPYDWSWLGGWCDCSPDVGSGVGDCQAVEAYVVEETGSACVGVVAVGGHVVWSDEAFHVVWECDHGHEEPDGFCPCGCDGDCPYCSCRRADGPSQGSIRFRIGLGESDYGGTAGFAWFESEGPVAVTPQLFGIEADPDAGITVNRSVTNVLVTACAEGGRDVAISSVTNGVAVEVLHHGDSEPCQTWEITNVGGNPSVVRLVKRDGEGAVLEDWTYGCSGSPGEWTWEVADNAVHDYVPADPTVTVEDGTNWVYGADGRLERLTVCTNGEEIVVRTFGYDGEGRLALVDDGTNGCVTIAYDASGNVSEMTGPEGSLRAAWNANGVMTNLDTSAWNGPMPEVRPRLMGMNSVPPESPPPEGISPLDALMNFLYGEGAPMSMPFSWIETSWLRPVDFEAVRDFTAVCHAPGSYPISGSRVISTRGAQQYFLGHITIRLDGSITYWGHCNWSFEGTVSALDDRYDFNAANRGMSGETLTRIGRRLFESHGTPFTISFTGTKPLAGNGHCRN